MEKLTTMDIYELCNENQWFTCGSNRQYDKMFDYVRDANIDSLSTLNIDKVGKIALMIWMCSDDMTVLEITQKICRKFADKNGLYL